MSTSGTYSFTVNRDQVCKAALKAIGKLGEGESPSPEALEDCVMMLDMLMKQFQGKADYAPGLKTWNRKTGYLFLSSTTGIMHAGLSTPGWTNSFTKVTSTATAAASSTTIMMPTTGVTVGDNIGLVQLDGSLFWTTVDSITSSTELEILTALPVGISFSAVIFFYTQNAQPPVLTETVVLRNQVPSDQIVTFMTVQEYNALPTKNNPANKANITSVYVQRGLEEVTFFSNVGSSNDTSWYLVVEYMQETQDAGSAASNPAYPKEWFRALVWSLAKEMAPMYNSPWTDAHEANYVQALKIARNVEAETTMLFFQPNPPGYNGW